MGKDFLKQKCVNNYPVADSIKSLLVCFRLESKCTVSELCEISSRLEGADISIDNWNSWTTRKKTSLPSAEVHLQSIAYLMKKLCSTDEIYHAWYDRLIELHREESDKQYGDRYQRLGKNNKNQDVTSSAGIDLYNSIDEVAGDTDTQLNGDQKRVINIGLKWYLSLALSIIAVLLYLKIFANKVTPNSPHNESKYISGLLMEVFLLSDNIPSSQPIAEAILNYSNTFSFGEYLKVPGLESITLDKAVGVKYSGFIDIAMPGEYTFFMNYVGGKHVVNQLLKKCSVKVSVDDHVLMDSNLPIGLGQQRTFERKTELKVGKQDFELWFACDNLRSVNTTQDAKAYSNTSLTIYALSPEDKIPVVLDASQFFYKL